MSSLPIRFALWVCLFGWAVSASHADEPSEFVRTQAGELPIILSAPHGGKLDVPNVDVRKTDGRPTGGSGFVISRDTGTEELALQVAEAIEKRFGKKPHFVIARSHRKYLDPNRPPEIAFEDPDAKPIYDAYHAALSRACREVQTKFRKGLLLDLHGQSSAKDTVFRGTQDGKTVTLLRDRFGESAHAGDTSLFARLKAGGWKVHPDPLDSREQSGFRGGFIVQTYGSHQGYGIDAIQLEFGGDYRSNDQRSKTADTLTQAVAEYSASFLEITAPAKPATKSSSLDDPKPKDAIAVAVYRGPGTSESRNALVKILEADSKLFVRDISPEEIQSGKLANFDVLIQPGGSGGGQGKALGEAGRQKVREFVQGGGGFIGVCAGAYLATCDYDWSLHILDAKVVDRQHWNRGFGTVEISLSPQGRELLQADRDRVSIYYHQGPLLAPADNPNIPDFNSLAKFETEIAKNGAPTGVMPGCTAIAIGPFHNGRVFCFSPHPERTEGQEHLLRHAVIWTAQKPK